MRTTTSTTTTLVILLSVLLCYCCSLSAVQASKKFFHKFNSDGLYEIGRRGAPMSRVIHPSLYHSASDSSTELDFSCIKVYGKYCGPGWCGGNWFNGCKGKTQKCNFSVAPINAVDSCCKVHDKCCIENRGSCGACDADLALCLSKTSCDSDDFACNMARGTMKGFFTVRSNNGQTCC